MFVNDWGAPRSGGRTHKGNDMFAAWDTPLVAVVDGAVRHDVDDLGGVGVWLVGDDGVSYYYAHLSRWEGEDRSVARGEVVGYVGDTGNAAGGPPHLHFGIRAPSGEMVNPYPTVRALCVTVTRDDRSVRCTAGPGGGMADTADSKSAAREGVRVRIPPRAHRSDDRGEPIVGIVELWPCRR